MVGGGGGGILSIYRSRCTPLHLLRLYKMDPSDHDLSCTTEEGPYGTKTP